MRRLDLEDVIKGKGNYVDDIPFSGYYGVFVRSQYPHAFIKKVDVEGARRKGALVFTAEDLRSMPSLSGKEEQEGSSSTSLLAFKKVRYVGEPIALVIAKGPYEATDLAEEVTVDYEPLPAVNNVDEALKNEVLVFEELHTNEVYKKAFEYGEMPRDDERIELNLYWSRSSGNPIETFGVIATPSEEVTIISNVQAPQFQSSEISKYFKVRVIPTRHGGSFGSKFSVTKYAIILGLASLKFHVPIKWIETRTEHLMASNSSGPERKFKVTAYFKRDGTITGLDFKVWEDIGASLYNGQAFKPTGILAGPYKVKNIRYDVSLVATNKNPPGAFRGAGTPPHTWALERTIDAIADELKMERLEVRRKNLIDSFPYDSPYAHYDSGNPKGLLELALSRKDIWSLREKGYGVGLACSTDPSTPSGQEGVKLSIKKGKVVLGIGYGPEGQGNEHVGKVLVSRLLKIPVEDVEVEMVSSDESPSSFGPGGSRMAVFLAGAIKGAVEELTSKLRRKYNAEYKDGYLVRGEERIPITSLDGEEVSHVYSQQGKTRFIAYPFACDIAVVKVDEETGLIKPVKLVVYLDPGTPLDEEVVKEQVIGGSAIGVSVALYENYIYENGQLLTLSLSDYGLPTADQMPEFEVNLVPTPSPYTPFGEKGIGEIPVGIAAAAVTSAVEDAIKRRINRVPIRLVDK
ncbi:xanthine dehydrogenase family protein molybdopterin-binding subunit [Acidianus sp. HS-5]|uniref:xanthine dehydrogenase family protein molybdopterin-binding subunit n=1 Tax=Acidianus sp. HS-5 TaxID=2886040 RepID=UPI001F1D4B58|nr:xanthine dehydrogenase family protein molybdopterin-binding subunit [Acidianus sp. HS-5]BDC17745.1 aldehyde oxidase [Acidianus sp. HS-5]